MPILSRWLLGTALIYLLLGATTGAVMLGGQPFGLTTPSWMLPVHVEFMLVGWAVQLAMGVVWWILPRHKTAAGRGNERVAWTCFVVLNIGVLLAAAGSPLTGSQMSTLIGHAVEFIAAVGFGMNLWRRLPHSISPTGRMQSREGIGPCG